MKLIVVKNLNVARRFVEALNIREREVEYFKGEEFYITWVLDSGRDKASAFVSSCFNKKEDRPANLQSLLQKCKAIIFEAGTIEELKLFKEFYEKLNSNLPTQQIYINSLTRKSIQKAMRNLSEIIDIKGFLEDENSAFSFKTQKIKNIPTSSTQKVEDSKKYQIQLQFSKDFLNLNAYSEQIFPDEQSAQIALSTILRKGNLWVNDVKYDTETQQPPLIYNLTELEYDCKKSFGFRSYETFEIAESLYENGLITSPITVIRTISKENWQNVNGIVRALATKPSLELDLNDLKLGKFSKRIVNENSFIRKEGIYPTGIIPSALSLKEHKVYDLIALRFLESLSEPYIINCMEIKLKAVNHVFKFKANQLVESGWKHFQNSFYENHIEIYPRLPKIKTNESLQIIASIVICSS